MNDTITNNSNGITYTTSNSINYKLAADNEVYFPYLYKMMLEYQSLDHETKKKYMKALTEWYMREKDALNILDSKVKH